MALSVKALCYVFVHVECQHLVTEKKLYNVLQGTNNVYYETEYRNEWCKSNGTLVPCFLFARKFSQGAAMRLLSEGLVGPFDAATMLTALL